ncbi:MAG: transglycosylase domain-containing protein [Bdellovibrionales bacterium]|nr:transglycosylase domain-containing protein [Bdellovibrionales bacterium]
MSFKKIFAVSLLLFVVLLLSASGFAYYQWENLPDVNILNTCFIANMNQVEVCPKKQNYTRLKEISQNLIEAIIVSEDGAFWAHNGIDWFEIKQSLRDNFSTGRLKRGGSTITQQLVKNIFFSPEKTLSRKIKEAILAHRVEQQFSKKTILEKYMNVVEFGPNIYGIRAAAHHYFSKSPSELSVLESAFLAFLLPNPKGYYTYFEKGELSPFAQKMILLICKRLYFYHKIPESEYRLAVANVDRFPWYGFMEQENLSEDDFNINELNEDQLNEEFEKIIDEAVPQDLNN